MGQATTTKQLDVHQLEDIFRTNVRVIGNIESSVVEKTVVVAGWEDDDIVERLATYVFDPAFSSPEDRAAQIAQAMFDSFSDELGTMVVTPGSTFANNSVRDRVIAFIALKIGGRL